MQKLGMVLASGLIVSLSVPGTALSETRYAAPPATVLSGDLASPWILQLRQNPIPGAKQIQIVRQPILFNQKRLKKQVAFRPQVQPKPVIPQVSATENTVMIPAAKPGLDPKFLPQLVAYESSQNPGTIIIDTSSRFLYLVEEGGMARRYGVGVGKEGFEWSGTNTISRKAEWPDWRPPEEMRARERAKGRELPVVMVGGPENPLGARALYLGSTLYRIHGTNRPDTIGKAMSSGCIRMRNEDVTDLYERVNTGTKVIVL
jgi:lipoprotein-anchoring transpeptidase ErfK/SrfK